MRAFCRSTNPNNSDRKQNSPPIIVRLRTNQLTTSNCQYAVKKIWLYGMRKKNISGETVKWRGR